jgi:hypothetical protein
MQLSMTPGQGSWYNDYLDMMQRANQLAVENATMAQQLGPYQRRIAALESFVRFVARSRQRRDGSCGMCGAPAALAGEPERHHPSCLIVQARTVLVTEK